MIERSEKDGDWLRGILSIPEIGMRVPWFRERLRLHAVERSCHEMDGIVRRAQLGEPESREALLTVAIALVQEREADVVRDVRQFAARHALWDLERLVRDGPEASPEFEGDERVPSYSSERELSVGERRSLARRATRDVLEKLVLDPHPLVLQQLFESSRLVEADVVRIAARRPLRAAAIETLTSSVNWLRRTRVRLTLVLNPGCPHGVAMPLVSTFPREDLQLLVSSTTISLTLRTAAHELLERLPPYPDRDDAALH